jgi:hypothetical protein
VIHVNRGVDASRARLTPINAGSADGTAGSSTGDATRVALGVPSFGVIKRLRVDTREALMLASSLAGFVVTAPDFR